MQIRLATAQMLLTTSSRLAKSGLVIARPQARWGRSVRTSDGPEKVRQI